jgi:Ca-activated chloride channel family protein
VEEADELKVTVKLNSKQGLRTIWSPSHTISTERSDNHHAKVVFDAKNSMPDKDFFLYYSVSDKDMAANVVANKAGSEDGYYLLTLSPPVEAKEIAGKDIVLVADTSGSMAGERMTEARKALRYIIQALSPQDRFSIVQFNTDAELFKTQLVAATPENKRAANAFIDDLEARGGTNIGGAMIGAINILEHGGAAAAAGRPGFIVMMTDGEPTVGETTIPGLLRLSSSKRDIRIFDFGVGYDVNTRLLDRLAEEHHGTAHYIEPSESFETSLANFYNKIRKPVLTDVKIAYDGIQVKDTYPRDVKDIFAGSQVLLLGRYKGSGSANVKVTGNLNGVQKAYTFPVKFASEDLDNTYLPRMWAMRRIAHLTDVAQANGDTKEVVDEIIALSKRYGIISAYTSYLVTDPNEPASLNNLRRLRASAMQSNGLDRGAATGVMHARAASPSAHTQRSISMDMFAARKSMPYPAPSVGQAAVFMAKDKESLKNEVAITADEKAGVKNVEDKTFYLHDGVWTDSAYDEKTSGKPTEVAFGSKEYFDLIKLPGIAKYLSVGKQVVLLFNGKSYRITYHEST